MANIIMGSNQYDFNPLGYPAYPPAPLPGSATAPVTPGETSSWQDWLKVALQTGVAIYSAKNQPKSPVASKDAQPQSSWWPFPTSSPGSSVQGQGSSGFSPMLLLAAGGIFLIVVLILRR
jgi:hypothetical protein